MEDPDDHIDQMSSNRAFLQPNRFVHMKLSIFEMAKSQPIFGSDC